MRSFAKAEEREVKKDDGLSTAIEDLDAVFSQYIRLRDSDEWGYITCPTCGDKVFWKESDNMHFCGRRFIYTRFSEDNCHAGCVSCNRIAYGNDPYEYLRKFGKWLEAKRPGLVEQLEEQAATVYRYSVSEIKGLISHYSKEVAHMRKKIPEVKN